jgi:hypothetical protein
MSRFSHSRGRGHPRRRDDEIASYRAYYQDLPVYLERIVTVVAWRRARFRRARGGYGPVDDR